MAPPGTFERVYAAIRQRLRDGVYRPGARLEPRSLSDELNASVTPIRDALHRLAGERLVEAPPHEGFRVPLMTETLLRQLYGWHLDLLLLAVMKRSPAAASPMAQAEEESSRHERLKAAFRTLARSAANPEHLAAYETLSQRLDPAQRLEERFLTAIEQETDEIVSALEAHDRKALRRSLLRYHRRRERIVPQLVAALLEGASSPAHLE